jgi:hypothetical protein
MKKEEYEIQKNTIIKKNNPFIWWILSLIFGGIAVLSMKIVDYENSWIGTSLYFFAISLFITGVFKSMNKAKKLSQLEQNSQTETE